MRIPKTADAWVQAMEQSNEGNQILQNLREEENVPANAAKKFFEELGEKYTAGDDPITHFKMTRRSFFRRNPRSVPKFSRLGPAARLREDTGLTYFSVLGSRFTDTEEFRSAGINLRSLKANPRLVDKISKLTLGGRTGIVWTALLDPIDNDIKAGARIPDVIDRLGREAQKKEIWYQVTYNSDDLQGKCHLPTVLHPGANMYFRPAPKCANHGMTHPCSFNGQGYPECVHGKCVLSNPGIRPHVI